MIRQTLSVLIACGLAVSATSQSSSGWFFKPRVATEPLSGEISLCTDTIRGRVHAVTGTGSSSEVSVSTWDGRRWTIKSTSLRLEPGYSIAFDSTRDRIVVWGRGSRIASATIYEWDGSTWQRFPATVAPPSNRGAAMAFDPVRQMTVLFGGNSPTGWTNDTWGWNGSKWTQITSQAKPSPRTGAAMVFDPVSNGLLLHGGSGLVSDTWILGSQGWVLQSSPRSPQPYTIGGWKPRPMTVDRTTGEIILIGSPFVQPRTGWRWLNGEWQTFPLVTPLLNFVDRYDLAFDPSSNEVVLFGRSRATAASETWVYRSDLPAPSFESIGSGCGTPRATLAPSLGAKPYLGSTFTLEVTNLHSTLPMGILSAGISDQMIGSVPLPLDLSLLGMPNCQLYHSFDLARPMILNNGAGSIDLNLPADPTLRGVRFFVQAAAGRLATNAGAITLGLR